MQRFQNGRSPPMGLHGSSVDACWHPLTPEHGFPSLQYRAQGAPPRPATFPWTPFPLSKGNKKNRRRNTSCKKQSNFLRRHYPHQVKGRSLRTSSQPAYELPCFYFLYSTPNGSRMQEGKRNLRRKNLSGPFPGGKLCFKTESLTGMPYKTPGAPARLPLPGRLLPGG